MYIKTPRYVPTNAVINVRNVDYYDIVWAVASALHPTTVGSGSPFKYKKYFEELNKGDLDFPLPIEKVPEFENLNPALRLSIYRYDRDTKKFTRIYRGDAGENKVEIDLLLVDENGENHYVWIKRLDSLFFRHNNTRRKKFVCRRCMKVMNRKTTHDTHSTICEM